MGKVGGSREGAGRKPGSLNRKTVEVLAGALEQGQTPIEYMLSVLHDAEADPKLRAWAAEKSAPYIHPRPAPLQRTVAIDLPACDTAEGAKQAMAKLIEATAAGELAPAEAQSFAALIEGQRKTIETADILDRLERLEQAQTGGTN